jgi:hypothetical protein
MPKARDDMSAWITGLFLVLVGCATMPVKPLPVLRLVSATPEPPGPVGFTLCSLELRTLTFPPPLLDNDRVLGLCLQIRNDGPSALTVDWSRVSLVVDGRASPVLHRGVRLAARTTPSTPSVIPPGAALDDFVYPRDSIQFAGGHWRGATIFEGMRPGHRFTLFMPMMRGQEVSEQQFVFEIRQ